jgi:hypothetical protein
MLDWWLDRLRNNNVDVASWSVAGQMALWMVIAVILGVIVAKLAKPP